MSAVNGGVGAKKRLTLQTNQHWKVRYFISSVVCICNLYLIFGTLLQRISLFNLYSLMRQLGNLKNHYIQCKRTLLPVRLCLYKCIIIFLW